MVGRPGVPMLVSSISSNGEAVVSLRLKPVVVAFARLFATASWRLLSASSPVAAMYSPLITPCLPWESGRGVYRQARCAT